MVSTGARNRQRRYAGRAFQRYLAERRAAGHSLASTAPVLADPSGTPMAMEALTHIARRMESLLRVTRDLNVYFCIETGKALRERRQDPSLR